MSLDYLIVMAIVAVAIVAVGLRFCAALRKGQGDCGCGCGKNCPSKARPFPSAKGRS